MFCREGWGVEQVWHVCCLPYGKPYSVQALLVRTVQEQLRREFCLKRRRFCSLIAKLRWQVSDTLQCKVYTSLFGAKFPAFKLIVRSVNFSPQSDGGSAAIDEVNKQTRCQREEELVFWIWIQFSNPQMKKCEQLRFISHQ